MERESLHKASEDALNWLNKAQDVGEDDGFASHYHLENGWYPSYPEVTGYIISTLLQYAEWTGRADLKDRAIRATNWLLNIQMGSGGFQGRLITDKPITEVVFNTGMILFGLVSSYRDTKNTDYFSAAKRAGDWLIMNQEPDGVWRKFLTLNGNGETHIYHTRVSWALLELFSITSDIRAFEAARKNIEWALKHQESTGWFGLSCLFEENNFQPLIHFLVYTIRGILEAGLLLEKPSWIDAAKKAARGLLKAQQIEGTLYARYDKNWNPTVSWKCLVGIAQISIVYMKLYQLDGHEDWMEAANKNIGYLSSLQGKGGKDVNGAIAGSEPIDGPYMANCYLSWATKFFLDALLTRDKIMS